MADIWSVRRWRYRRAARVLSVRFLLMRWGWLSWGDRSPGDADVVDEDGALAGWEREVDGEWCVCWEGDMLDGEMVSGCWISPCPWLAGYSWSSIPLRECVSGEKFDVIEALSGLVCWTWVVKLRAGDWEEATGLMERVECSKELRRNWLLNCALPEFQFQWLSEPVSGHAAPILVAISGKRA